MFRIRRAAAADLTGIHVAHTSAIRGSCHTHYAPEEIEAWATRTTPASYADDVAHRDIFVAEGDRGIVGFAVLGAEEREVRAVYVRPDAGSRGIGRALLRVIEDTARLHGVRDAWLDASLNAEAFYRRAGWRKVRDTRHTFPGGRDIACVHMTKSLAAPALVVREETPADVAAIHTVNAAAFERDEEAVLVDRLRAAGALALSLVATLDHRVLGHVAFSPVAIDGLTGALGLAPMAVLPAYQGCALGSRLVEEGLARLGERGVPAVVVLGHADYYPRFGFVPASRFGLRYDDGVPDEVFMAAELVPGSLPAAGGIVRYHREFDALA
jgi:putative acetyltransferase